MKKYDVVSVKIGFSKLPIGKKGVCIHVGKERNGVMKLTVLMENDRVVTLTGREADLFFRHVTTMDTRSESHQKLLETLKDLNLST